MPWAKYYRKRILGPLVSHEGMSLAELVTNMKESYSHNTTCRLLSHDYQDIGNTVVVVVVEVVVVAVIVVVVV